MISGAAQTKENDSRWVSPEEIEYVAENILVTVVPKFELQVLYMMEGEYGPFVAQTPVEVPLWLAIHLKKIQRANIKCPSWLDVDHLTALLDEEKRDPNLSQKLPFHYIEIATIFFSDAPDDVEDLDRLRTLVEDISNIRATKLRKGMESVMDSVKGQSNASVRLTGISALELNKIRPSFLHGLEMFWKMRNMYNMSARQAESTMRESGAGGVGTLSRAQQLRQKAAEAARARQEAAMSMGGSGDEGDDDVAGEDAETQVLDTGGDEADGNPFGQGGSSETLVNQATTFEDEFENS